MEYSGPGYVEFYHSLEAENVTVDPYRTGRFLEHHSSDDILFGNTFDRPLKLPWGSGAALKFMK